MQKTKLRKRLQRGLALLAITSFLGMPVNLACAANNITAGNSAVGDKTNISNGSGNVTDITSGFVHGGTGLNHFGNFDIGTDGTANLRAEAGKEAFRYINMVDKGININGTLNAFTTGALPANVMFISPEGMAVGVGGVLNVGGLQVITPATTDYSNLVGKLGAKGASLSEADHSTIVTAAKNQVAGGDANIYIGGKINSTGEVVLSAGDGIYFYNGGIIDTTGKLTAVTGSDGETPIGFKDYETGTGSQLASVSLFANTGNIIEYSDSKLNGVSYKGQTLNDAAKTKVDLLDTTDIAKTNEIKIKSSRDITLSAVGGGIGGDISLPGKDTNVVNSELAQSVAPINVSIKSSTTPAEDGKLNITVATTPALDKNGNQVAGQFQGYAAVANNSPNLKVGEVKGYNVKIQNKGGTLATTEAIGTKDSNGKSNVGTLYLDAGALDVEHKITTNNIIRLNGASGIEADGNLEVLGDGYISVYSENGAIKMNDAKIKSGNINIKSNAADSSVTHGNLEITNRPSSIAGMLGLEDNSTLIQGVKSTEKSFRSDGIHVTSKNDITQKTGTAISSAGIVELNAGGNVTSTIKGYVDGQTAKDVVIVTAKDADLTTTDVVRLGAIEVDNLTVNAGTKDSNNAITNLGSIVVDDAVKAKGNITINATDKVTVRPHVKLEDGTNTDGTKWEHYSYGKIESDGIAGADGTAGKVTINANNGIFAVNPLLNNDNSSVNASLPVIINKAGDVKLTTTSTNGNIKVIPNTDGVTPTDERLTIAAVGKVDAEGQDVHINLVNGATNDTDKKPSVATSGIVGTITARHNAEIGSVGKVLITDQISATNNVIVNAVGDIIQDTTKSAAIVSGNNMTLTSTGSDIGQAAKYLTVDVNGEGKLTANALKGNIYINGLDDLSVAGANAGKDLAITTLNGNLNIDTANAGKDMTLTGGKNINAKTLISTNDMTITANGADSNIVLGSASAGKAGTTNGSMTVTATKDVKINAATANKDMSITSTDGTINVTGLIQTNTGDMTLTAESGNVVVQAPSGSSAVAEAISGNDMTIKGIDVYLTKATAENDMTVTATGMADIGTITATEGNMTVTANKDVGITTATAGKDMTISSGIITMGPYEWAAYHSQGNLLVENATAGKNINMSAYGRIEVGEVKTTNGNINISTSDYSYAPLDETNRGIKVTKATSGGDLNIISTSVGGSDIELTEANAKGDIKLIGLRGGKGGMSIDGAPVSPDDLFKGGNITVGTATAGKDFQILTGGKITATSVTATTGDLDISTAGDIEITNAIAGKNANAYSVLGNVDVTGKIEAGGDLTITAGYDQKAWEASQPLGHAKLTPEIIGGNANIKNAKAGNDMTVAAQKEAKIASSYAKNNATVTAQTIKSGATDTTTDLVAGKNITLTATAGDIGEASKHFSVASTAGQVKAEAKTTGANIYLGIGADSTTHVSVIEAANDVSIQQTGDIIIDEVVKAGNDVKFAGNGAILQNEALNTASIVAGNDMSLTSNNKNVGDPNKYLKISLNGDLDAAAPNGGVYIEGADDALNVTSATAGKDIAIKVPNGALTVAYADAGNDLTLTSKTDIGATIVSAGNNMNIDAGGKATVSSATTTKNTGTMTIKAGKDVEVTTANAAGNVKIDAGQNAKLTKVTAGKNADVTAKGNIDVTNILEAGENLTATADGHIHQATAGKVSYKSGKDMSLTSKTDNVGDPNKYLQVSVGGKLDASAEKGGVYIGTPDNLTIGKVVAGNDAVIIGDGYIHQTERAAKDKPAITTGKNLTLKSNDSDVGDPNNYLSVKVGEALNATAPNGGVYIEGIGNLNIDLVEAKTNVGLEADGYIHQIAPEDPANPRVISGGNMHFKSANDNVGDPDNYLQVSVGGVLDASAPKGGVYIGSRGNLLIDEINAGKDVGIETGGWIHETGNKKPAITSGEDMHLISFDDNVGDPDHYLTVSVGGELDAAAPTEGKGVYIYGYGDLTVDRVVAGEDVGIGGNKDIILPSDRDEGNIIAGRDVIIKAGDNVLNGGGEKLAIDAGRDIDVTANINENNPAGSIGKLPYGDLQYSINVTLDGEVRADEIGVPVADKILNIHIMGQDNGDDLGFDMDDRDQRNMKYLTEDDDSASVRNHRDHLRYNVATSEYVLIDSNSDSGSKVQDVLNISKQGMLVQTDETPNLGDNIQITLEYKGLPFTVEGTVVRADAAKGIVGVKFNSIDQFTSSMILYLGMLNGR